MQRSIVLWFLIGGLAINPLLGCVSITEAAEFKSEEGVSFQYPDDWVAVTQVNQVQLDPQVRAYLKENQIDLSTVHVMVMRLNDQGFSDNFNVLIAPTQIPVNASSLARLQSQKSDESKQHGFQITELSGNLIDVADRKCFNFTHQTQFPFLEELVSQRQVIIPGGGKSFVITLSASPATYGSSVSTFEAMLKSLHVPPPESRIKWDKLGQIIGTIIGASLGLFVMRLIKKRRSSPVRQA